MSKRIPIFIGFLLLLIAVWLQVTNVDFLQRFINRLEDLAYDVQLRTKVFTHPTPFQTSVAIVDIDDKTLAREGRWPWPRSKVATLIARTQEAGAVVIALDMIFPEKETNIVEDVIQAINKNNLMPPDVEPALQKLAPFFDNDVIFANSLKQGDSVLGTSFSPRNDMAGILPAPVLTLKTPAEKELGFTIAAGYVGNIPLLQTAAKSAGFINVFGDDDGIIRRVPLLLRYKDNLYPSLALEAVRLFLLSNVKLITAPYGSMIRLEGVDVENHQVPTDAKGQMIIPFRGRSFTMPYFSATDVLNKKIPPDALQGKIVFVGTSATGEGDLQTTAIESAYPGVEIQASVADGILSNNFSYKPAWSAGAELFLTILLGSIFAWAFPYLGPRMLSLMIILIPAMLVFANNELWERTGLIISIFIPSALTSVLALVNMIYGYLFETRKREQLKSIFGQYVPEEHIDEMLKSTDNYGMKGDDREMTVLFADIRNFTTISERLTASQLKEMLNDFFTPMTESIFKHHGTIDKYVGDLIMAFWGAPLQDKRHAQHAIAAALEMQKVLKKLLPEMAAHGWPELNMGIGLNSGVMSVGDMGSKFRRNYTVLGDAVNLASRVEGLTKYYGVNIIVTEFTRTNQKNFIFRELDRVRVKGKADGVGLFEVVCRKSELSPELQDELAKSDAALQYYFASDWQKAREAFTKLNATYPDVKFYQLYLKRLDEFEKTPPPSDWGGVYTMTSK